MKSKIIKLISFVFIGLFIPVVLVFSEPTIANPLRSDNIMVFIQDVVNYIFRIGSAIAVLALIYSGYLFVKARGNKSELETAKETFKNTIIGIVLLLGAVVIASIIRGTVCSIVTCSF